MACTSMVHGFSTTPLAFTSHSTRVSSSFSCLAAAKGFGEKPAASVKKEKSAGQVDRDTKAQNYDDIAASGGQEYRIFVRMFGSDDMSWLPTGTIAVPRGAQVSDAIYANEAGLKTGILRSYEKLKGQEAEFEFGYNLKLYPDDPVEVAIKGSPKSSGPSIGNWLSNLLSPIDASNVPPPSSK
eukprot:CAMPEP_0198285590 /NCGR_PEP_ID=MMETSP1449-20131203/4847_1 /TAXON_ID=420275 /ORGANISM="Attheya septentrionalis, Strain CCMP2084" /LENGTH=182 /DNA_ID=CAMNT_0043983059 /DNA_START=103 /DNA_END=651 /DNA_ORIENTATION=-